jgi:hypothetical protein
MSFFRVKTDRRGNRYLYEETRTREGKKVKSRSRYIGRLGGSGGHGGGPQSCGPLAPALPFMIAYDLISGRRVEQVKRDMARRNPNDKGQPARAWARQKWSRLSIAEIQARAAKSTPYTLTAEEKATLDAFKAFIGRSQVASKESPAKGTPTDEDETQHANWSFNQAAQLDEDVDAYNADTTHPESETPDGPAPEGGQSGSK